MTFEKLAIDAYKRADADHIWMMKKAAKQMELAAMAALNEMGVDDLDGFIFEGGKVICPPVDGRSSILLAHPGDSPDQIIGWQILGVCPECDAKCWSAIVIDLAGIGRMINDFKPEKWHSCEA